jgi:hypothetical protein
MNETALIDQYLLGQLSPEDRVLFEAKLLIDDSLAEKTATQQHLHNIVVQSARRQLRREIAAAEQHVFEHAGHGAFQALIRRIFH